MQSLLWRTIFLLSSAWWFRRDADWIDTVACLTSNRQHPAHAITILRMTYLEEFSEIGRVKFIHLFRGVIGFSLSMFNQPKKHYWSILRKVFLCTPSCLHFELIYFVVGFCLSRIKILQSRLQGIEWVR